jgi:glycosyltransferase involved in cell wall biosynthesis
MQKAKIIHIIPTLGVGGAERIVIDIVKNINKREFEATIIVLFSEIYCDEMYKKVIKENNISVTFLNKKQGFDFSIIFKLIKIFKEIRPDVIHTHTFACIYSIFPAIFSRVPLRVHTVHSMAKKELPWYYQKIMYLSYKMFKFVPVAISTNVKKSIMRIYKLQPSKIPQIDNGIELTKYYKKKYDINKKQIKLVHVGRFQEPKNHRLLIDIFLKVRNTYPDSKLILVGDGELKFDIERKVKYLGLERSVEFTGVVSNVEDYLADADIFVLASIYEGLPLVVIEAMAAGLPVLSTNVGGISELVEDGFNGYLVDINSEEEFVTKLNRLIKDDTLRGEFSINSLEKVKEYDVKKMIKSYEELYHSISNN